ncbi:glycoside hydrolase family 16 protein [Allohahella sp. A8]|uniref:glycoside hydrolase family 16 protein n=1 Tax=Allohahella sp. A8 TaxID=3141461 RepID=UPI003A7F8E45
MNLRTASSGALAAFLFTCNAHALSGVEPVDASSLRFFVDTPAWADVHYRVDNGHQLNIRMQQAGGRNTYLLSELDEGADVSYAFTYWDLGCNCARETGWSSYQHDGGSGPGDGGDPGNGGNPDGGDDAGWSVVWEDTFDQAGAPNSANWNYHVGNGFNPGLGGFQGWGNGEWEWYRPENSYVENGQLIIRGEFDSAPTEINGRSWYQWSGRLTTQGKQSWQYGRIEARIAVPGARGTWPAFWMMGDACDGSVTTAYTAPMSRYDVMASNWSSCGEVDIMEHRNTEQAYTQNLFWDIRAGLHPWAGDTTANVPNSAPVGDPRRFNLYTIEWDAQEIRWYLNRESNPEPVHVIDISKPNMEEFHRPYHLILNLALSGTFTGPTDPDINDFPLYMKVDYVRVWKQNR